MDIGVMLKKLENTSWLPEPTNKYLVNAAGLEGQLNLAWMLSGKPKVIGSSFFQEVNTRAIWFLAGHVLKLEIEGASVAEYATLLSPAQFLTMVQANQNVFGQFLPIPTWVKAFKAE